MRVRLRTLLSALALGVTSATWAQEAKPTAESKPIGTVYRCTLADGAIWYKNKPMEDADCRVVGSYKLQPTDATKPKAAPGWIYLTSSAIADTYLQPSSIKRSGGRVGVWVMENYRAPQTNDMAKAPYLSALRRLSVQCEDRQVFAQKTTFTSAPFGSGEYVGEWRPLGAYGDFATPGSIDDGIAAHVCRSK